MMKYAILVLLIAACDLYAADANSSPQRQGSASSRTVGVASWYGRLHQGKIMANGAPFNPRALTAASRTLPLNSWVRVINLRNGKSVDLRVTDRGPNKRLQKRIVDVSEATAEELGFRKVGLAVVAVVPLTQGTSDDRLVTSTGRSETSGQGAPSDSRSSR
jgi:peptidoglycan lytic transglycosylase